MHTLIFGAILELKFVLWNTSWHGTQPELTTQLLATNVAVIKYSSMFQSRRGQPASPVEQEKFQKNRIAALSTPDAGQIASASQRSFSSQRITHSSTDKNYHGQQQNDRPIYNYKRPATSHSRQTSQPNYQPSPIRKRVNNDLEAVSGVLVCMKLFCLFLS